MHIPGDATGSGPVPARRCGAEHTGGGSQGQWLADGAPNTPPGAEAVGDGTAVTAAAAAGLALGPAEGRPVGAGVATGTDVAAAGATGISTDAGQAVRLAGAPASTGTAVGRMPQPVSRTVEPASRRTAPRRRRAVIGPPPGRRRAAG
ncbi:hypothetical protein KCH_31600 [Kitasatospora cheerisanensis KCTC 2395]|uniref:Uncharacterized protein n=1 Tax=Kitasatospora cheerisanensis KCTC 2395 TaxID=1348663 RepID=A0A066Z3Y7_9ACTN|nr:hypothetical protein KCH_31600 [Kitasatospora cheerisanensis KCTC 2395]